MGFFSLDKKSKKINKINEEKETVKKLESIIDNEEFEILNKGYYEWKIKNWQQLSKKSSSTQFKIGNYKWKLELEFDNSSENNIGFVSLNLISLNTINIYAKFVFCIRNYYDPTCIYYGEFLSNYFSKKKSSSGSENFIRKYELFTKNENLKKSIVDNDRCIVGVYVIIYKPEKEYCINEVKNEINNENYEVLNDGIYEWKINNWDQITNREYSPVFSICNHEWKLELHNRSSEPYITLKSIDVLNDIFAHISTKYVIYIRNSENFNYFYFNQEDKPFCYFENEQSMFSQRIYKSELFNEKGNLNPCYIINNTLIVGVYICTYKYDEEQCKNELNKYVKYYGYYKDLNEGFYEWKIEDWNQLGEKEYSPEFMIDNHKWRLELYPNGIDNRDYISLYLKCTDRDDDPSYHICAKKALYIRNYDDHSYFYCNGELGFKKQSLLYYNRKNNSSGYNQFITKSELFSRNEVLNRSLVENNKCVIGVYLRTAKFKYDQHKDELKEIIHDNRNFESEGFLEWDIDDWNQLKRGEFSPKFNFKKITFGRHTWMLQLFPNGNGEANENYVSLYLKNVTFEEDIYYSPTSHVCAKAILYIKNCENSSCYVFDEIPLTYYSKTFNSYGFNKFIKTSELFSNYLDHSIIENNRCTAGAYIRTYIQNEGKSKEFSNIIKNKLSNGNREILEENLHELKIKNWEQHDKSIISTFVVGNYKWKLEIFPNNGNDNNYVKLVLKNLDVENDDFMLICIKSILFIKNIYDVTYYIDDNDSFAFLSKDYNSISFSIRKDKLFKNSRSSTKNNECIAGVYIRIYKCEEDLDINEIIRYQEGHTAGRLEENETSRVQGENEMRNTGNQRNEKMKKDTIKQKLETPSLVISLSDFTAYEYDQLDIKKDEFLIVIDWNYKDGWVYGHRKDNKNEKGSFPKVFAKICKEDNNESNISKEIITPNYRINFENKVKQLRNESSMKIGNFETLIFINRENLYNEAFDNIMNKSASSLKGRLKIKYTGEEGIDAGGLLRDFFYQISKEIGNPNYSLLQYSHDDSYELEINPNSGIAEPNHLDYFKFIGRILGLAIFHKQNLSLTFSLLFYKKLLDKPLKFSDLEYVDPELYKNINWLKNNQGADNLCLTFEIDEIDCFGNHIKKELKSNGSNIDVTDSNKQEYIDLVVKNKLYTKDEEQLNALKEGFYEIIPRKINTLFNEVDLKYLISGINEIDINDWENNTDYEGYNKNDITIVNFWKCVEEFDKEKQTQLLIFATGTSQVPVTGFKDLQGSGKIQHFKLKRFGTEDDLPKSHTCFNRIDLPPYSTYTQLKQKLLRAITEGMGGFEME
jgi:hypothetical protein